MRMRVCDVQERLNQKEEAIAKYQALLADAREELQATHKRHEGELKHLQAKLHVKSDESFHKFKTQVNATLSKPTGSNVPTNQQVTTVHAQLKPRA